jgi:L-ascorbate metabolism protein UlaG (beta-lactamase superfamily)
MAIQQMLDSKAEQQRQEMEQLLGKTKKNNTMKIKKIGHCCLIIETKGVRIMTDPGTFTTEQNEEKNIDIVVISHEHGDHFHIESVKAVIANNPNVKIITNSSVGKLLDAEGIAYEVVEHGGATTTHDISFEGHGEHHAVIYKEFGQVQNTGYFVDGKLFYPGDALTNPEKPIDILALPTAGPFLKLAEVVDYAMLLKPARVFPVHDAILKSPAMFNAWIGSLLEAEGITFVEMNSGDEKEF